MRYPHSLMAYPGGYGSPHNDPRNNPFAQHRQYDADSDAGDHYGNSSTTHLAASQQYFDQRGHGTYISSKSKLAAIDFLQSQNSGNPTILPLILTLAGPIRRLRGGC
jgi:hypothetical protein